MSEVLVCPDVWRSRSLVRPVSPSDRSLRRSLTRSFARSAWAQTLISVSWRTHETVYCSDGGPPLQETESHSLPASSCVVLLLMVKAHVALYRLEGSVTHLPDSSRPTNLGSPETLLLLQTNFFSFGTTQTLQSVRQTPVSPSPGLEDEVGVGGPFGVLVARPTLSVGVGGCWPLGERLHHLCDAEYFRHEKSECPAVKRGGERRSQPYPGSPPAPASR